MIHGSHVMLVLATCVVCDCGDKPASTPPVDASVPRAASQASAAVDLPDRASSAWAPLRTAQGAELLDVPAQVLGSAAQRAAVMPAFRAQVLQILVEPGQAVTSGAPLVIVRMPEVVRAAGAYVAAGLRWTAYNQRRDQLQTLRGEGLARLSDLAEVAASLSEASAAQREAQSVLQGAGLSPSDAGSLSDGGGKVTLRSPIAGVVTQVSASIGQMVEPSGSALLHIVGSGDTRIEARLPSLDVVALRYELVTPQRSLPLTFLQRAPAQDPRDGTAPCWFLPPAGAGLVAGQTGRLRVRIASPTDPAIPLWLIPTRALALGSEQAHVLRLRAGQTQSVPVVVLASTVGQALVRAVAVEDLTTTDRVAVATQLVRGEASP